MRLTGVTAPEITLTDDTITLEMNVTTHGYSGAPAVMVKPYAGMLAVFASEPAAK